MTALHLDQQFAYQHPDRPTLVVRLSWNGSQVDTEAMLDTGAAVCIFDTSLAYVLGIPLHPATSVPVLGIDGRIRRAPLVRLDVTVLPESAGIHLSQIAVAFLDGIAQTVGNLLGREGFFSAVDLGLSHAGRTIHLGRSGT